MGPDVEGVVVDRSTPIAKTVRERALEAHIEKLREGFTLVMDAIRADVNNTALVGTIYMDTPEEWTVLDYCEHMSLMDVGD